MLLQKRWRMRIYDLTMSSMLIAFKVRRRCSHWNTALHTQSSQSNAVHQETKRTTWSSPSSEQVLRGFSSPRTESMSCWLAVRRGWLSWRSGPLLRGRRGKPFSANLWHDGNLLTEMWMYGRTGRMCWMARRLWLGPTRLLRLIWHLCPFLRPDVLERTSCLVWHVSLLWIAWTDHANILLARHIPPLGQMRHVQSILDYVLTETWTLCVD